MAVYFLFSCRTVWAGACQLAQALYENVDLQREALFYRVAEAKTLAACRQMSQRGRLRGTVVVKFRDGEDSYFLVNGQIVEIK